MTASTWVKKEFRVRDDDLVPARNGLSSYRTPPDVCTCMDKLVNSIQRFHCGRLGKVNIAMAMELSMAVIMVSLMKVTVGTTGCTTTAMGQTVMHKLVKSL